MSVTFSTESLPAGDRLDAWEWNARKFCGDCRFQFRNRRAFHGSIETKRVGSLDLSRFSSSSLRFSKFPIENVHAEKFCTIITQLEGVRTYSQSNRAVILNPGDSTLIDSTLPWSSECGGDCVRLYLRAPRWLIENRLRVSTLPVANRISGTCALGATLFHLANSLYRQAEHLSPPEARAMIEAYFDIWSACVVHRGAEPSIIRSSVELYSRIETFIEEHLADPALNPSNIAAAAGMSVRHLHRLFAQRGCTVGDWIRECRLDRCRRDLADPRFRERTVTDIAFYWGFSESAHFSRSFKKQFGVSPRAFRSQPCTATAADEQTDRIETATSSRHCYPN